MSPIAQKFDSAPMRVKRLRLDADLLKPDVGGAVVVLEHRDPQPFRRKTQRVGHELPGEADRLAP